MSASAQRYAAKYAAKIEVPKVPKLTREEAQRLALVDRVLQCEHQRHADRLADVRRVADKLTALQPIVQAAEAAGAHIDVAHVELTCTSYSATEDGRRVNAVVLRNVDPLLNEWRKPAAANAVANALMATGWRIVYVSSEGSNYSLDRLVFMHGQRAVETTCMREWVLDAIEAGHITAATKGRHPATDTGMPLSSGTATATPAPRASQPHEG